MSRFNSIDLSQYPVSDIVEVLTFESYLARDRADFAGRWAARRLINPGLPEFDTLFLESDPSSVVLQIGAYRELLLRGHVNDRLRNLTLAGSRGRALDHIGATYYRTIRREITSANGDVPAVMEDDETYRQRLALAPESWSTAGPAGAYLFWGLSASGDVLDIAAYSEDEGTCLAPQVRLVVLAASGNGTASDELCEIIRTAVSRDELRPLGDLVTVESAVPALYNVDVKLRLRSGASAALIVEAAQQRIESYCSGRLRWIGDGATGPVWLIGRQIRRGTLAAAALGTDPNVLDVEVLEPVADVNVPHEGYTGDALAGVGSTDFEPLAQNITAHLFHAPRLGSITIRHEIVAGTWSA